MKKSDKFWMWVAACSSAFFSAQVFSLFMPDHIPLPVKWVVTAAIGMSFSVAVINNEQSTKPKIIGNIILALTTVLGSAMFIYGSLDASDMQDKFNKISLQNYAEISKKTKENMENNYITATAKVLTAASAKITITPSASAMFRAIGKKTKTPVEYLFLGMAMLGGCAIETALRWLSRSENKRKSSASQTQPKTQPKTQVDTQPKTQARTPVTRTRSNDARVSNATINAYWDAYNSGDESLLYAGKISNRRVCDSMKPKIAEATGRKILSGQYKITVAK